MKKTWSFKRKVQLILLALSLSALATSAYMAYRLNAGTRADKVDILSRSVESISEKIERALFEQYRNVQAFALSDAAKSGNTAVITKFMAEMMSTYAPVYDAMIVLDLSGNVVASNAIDKNGRPLDQTKIIGKNYSDEEWFQQAVAGKIKPGSANVTSLVVDEDIAKFAKTDGKVIIFTAPIRNSKTGEVIGVWSNRASWKGVVENVVASEAQKLKDHRFPLLSAAVVDGEGIYLINHDSKQVLRAKAPGVHDYRALNIGTWAHTVADEDQIRARAIEIFATPKTQISDALPKWTYILRVPESDPQLIMSMVNSLIGIFLFLIIAFFANSITSRIGDSLEHVIECLREDSAHVSKTASEVTQASTELSDISARQASSLQQTAASIEEINAMIKKSSENSSRSQEVAGESAVIAKRGRESVEKMSVAINEINVSNEAVLDQIGESNNQISEIARVIAEIGNKTKVINDIVFQTKLLSFNASVEAARAGEHGKGFAVVAEEVGNLAQMSGNAAKEISDMLGESIKKVESIVEDTKVKVGRLISDGRQKVQSGIVIAGECGKVLSEVVANIEELNSMVTEISVAGNEQSQGVNEITKAMNELDQSMHANVTTSQNVSGFAKNLSDDSVKLDEIVNELAVTITGVATPPNPETPGAPATKQIGTKTAQREKPPHLKVITKSPKAEIGPAPVRQLQKMTNEVPTSNDPRFKDV